MEDMARLAVFEQNSTGRETFKKTLQALIEFVTNILECPHNQERRKIKNDFIKESCTIDGFLDYLKYIGFEMNGNDVIYPMTKSLNDLRTSQAAMQRKLHFLTGIHGNNSKRSSEQKTVTKNNKKPKLLPSKVLNTRNKFLLKLENLFNDVLQYEEDELQEFAKLHIPIVTLQMKAIDRMREHQQLLKTGEVKGMDPNFDKALLIELLEWFKYSFFAWVDSPSCEKCGGDTVPNNDKIMVIGMETCRVEVYKCRSCASLTNFPRHNRPRTLLETRRGRCGEWASCFTLLCRALGYDTRYVYDTTDHVWCEVFDYDSNKWLHVDPCEGKLDTPLIYENGWGKKIEYVIAFSRDDIQDVTWRYSSYHKQVRTRRRLCEELELIENIILLREYRQKQVSEARRKYLTKRTVQELVDMLVERKPSDYEKEGRLSGSVQWKREREELGENKSHTFNVEKTGQYSIQYVNSKDEYRMLRSDNENVIIRKWWDGAFENKNIFRKEEKDWNMVYLARQDGEFDGSISWKICTTLERLILCSLSISATTMLYENGIVTWTLQFDSDKPFEVKLEETPKHFERRFKSVILKANLCGGRGDVSWQHAQLFRQSLKDSKPTFNINFRVDQN